MLKIFLDFKLRTIVSLGRITIQGIALDVPKIQRIFVIYGLAIYLLKPKIFGIENLAEILNKIG